MYDQSQQTISSGRVRRKMAFTDEEMRHHFAIEALDKPRSFRPQPYLYTCIRCGWIFVSMTRAARSLPWTDWAGGCRIPKTPSA